MKQPRGQQLCLIKSTASRHREKDNPPLTCSLQCGPYCTTRVKSAKKTAEFWEGSAHFMHLHESIVTH